VTAPSSCAMPAGDDAPAVPAAFSPDAFATRAWTPATKLLTYFAGTAPAAAVEIASKAPVIPGSATSTSASYAVMPAAS
jgi:hypothetical protein